MSQATLDRLFPPVSPPRETPSETAEYLWEPACSVYMYTRVRTGEKARRRKPGFTDYSFLRSIIGYRYSHRVLF